MYSYDKSNFIIYALFNVITVLSPHVGETRFYNGYDTYPKQT